MTSQSENPRPMRSSVVGQRVMSILGLGAAAVALFCAIRHFGMIQFGGMDASAFVQAGWRFFLGETPYKDLVTVAHPALFVPPGVAFCVFGCKWSSLVLLTAIVAVLMLILHYAVLRLLQWGLVWCFALAMVTQAVTFLPLSSWGHNQATSVSAAIFVAAACAVFCRPKSIVAAAALVLATTILSWQKANTAGVLLPAVFLTLVTSRRTWRSTLVCGLLALVLSAGLLYWARINPWVMIQSVLGGSGRITNLEFYRSCFFGDWYEYVPTYLMLLPILGAWVFCLLSRPKVSFQAPGAKRVLAVAVIALVTALWTKATNHDHVMNETPLLLTGILLTLFNPARLQAQTAQPNPDAAQGPCPTPASGATEGRAEDAAAAPVVGPAASGGFVSSGSRKRWVRSLSQAWLLAGITYVGIWGIAVTAERWRVRTIGAGMFYEDVTLGKPLSAPPFFEGMIVGPRLAAVLNDISKVLRNPSVVGLTNVSDEELKSSVFFGPRVEFGYAAFNKIPRRGLLLWWPGTGEMPQEKIDQAVAEFERWNPRLCFFWTTEAGFVDSTFMPQELMIFLRDHYRLYVTPSRQVTILVRNP